MHYSLTTVIEPAIEPVTVAEVIACAKLDEDQVTSEERTMIEGFIATARTAAELFTSRSFITRTLKLTLDTGGGLSPWFPGTFDLPVNYFDDAFPTDLPLSRGPVIAVTSITTYDTLNVATVYNAANYSLVGDRIVLNGGSYWPSNLRSLGASEILYTAGYGPEASDVPMPIRTAIMVEAARMQESRGLCNGECSGYAQRLLSQYRVMNL